jgi:hypothetical protein
VSPVDVAGDCAPGDKRRPSADPDGRPESGPRPIVDPPNLADASTGDSTPRRYSKPRTRSRSDSETS